MNIAATMSAVCLRTVFIADVHFDTKGCRADLLLVVRVPASLESATHLSHCAVIPRGEAAQAFLARHGATVLHCGNASALSSAAGVGNGNR